MLPVRDQAAQQIGPAQERAVRRARAAEHDVVAAAGARVPAVEHELLGHEPRVVRVLVEPLGDRDASRPSCRAGCTLTSMTPGSGVTLMRFRRGSRGGS